MSAWWPSPIALDCDSCSQDIEPSQPLAKSSGPLFLLDTPLSREASWLAVDADGKTALHHAALSLEILVWSPLLLTLE